MSPALEAEFVPAGARWWEGALGDPAGGLRPRRQHELLDLALVAASPDAEHAVLAPAAAPRVDRQLPKTHNIKYTPALETRINIFCYLLFWRNERRQLDRRPVH